MKLLLVVILLFLFASNLCAQQKMVCYNGVYTYGNNINKGGVGKLMIHRESDTTLLFHLDVNRGAPSYNSGETYGRIKIFGDSGVYHFRDTSGIYDCGLVFLFKKKEVSIRYTQDSIMHTECGFGYGVYAAGDYLLKSGKAPSSFKNNEGDTISFNAQTIDKWEEALGGNKVY